MPVVVQCRRRWTTAGQSMSRRGSSFAERASIAFGVREQSEVGLTDPRASRARSLPCALHQPSTCCFIAFRTQRHSSNTLLPNGFDDESSGSSKRRRVSEFVADRSFRLLVQTPDVIQ
jgi:hypothetical protein